MVAAGKVFASGGSNGGRGIVLAESGRGGAGLLCLHNLGIEPSIEEDKESEALTQEHVALALPAVLLLAGRIVEPVSGEGEVPAQRGQSFDRRDSRCGRSR